MSKHSSLLILLLGLQGVLTGASRADVPATLALDPATTCQILASRGLAARGGYRQIPGDDYRCASSKKTLNAGGGKVHEIQFYATGQADRIDRLVLHLAVYSKQDMQRAHRLMQETANALTQGILHRDLPAEVTAAIMGAVSGHWQSGGREFILRRSSLPYWGHELRLVIR
jgi:hypothetical protein